MSEAPTLLSAVQTALCRPHAITARLYTDGHQVRWLPRPMPGWFRLGTVTVKPTQPMQVAP